MLIRTQDKKSIINLDNVDTISIEHALENRMRIKYYAGAIDTVGILGEYSTEEKTIKVLDMIQKKYLEYGTLASHFGSNIESVFNIPKVFEMPQDSEV